MGKELFSTIREGESVEICRCRKGFGGSRHFWSKDHSDSVLPQHGDWCHTTPMSVPQTVFSSRSVYQRNIIGGWLHVIINLQTLITNKVNFFGLIVGIENARLNRVPWGRWWCGRILDLWWRRVRIFVKEALSWPLPPDDHKPLGTIKGLPRNVRGREENGFIWKAAAYHFGLMCHMEIFQLLCRKLVWEMRTDHCR